MCIRDRLVTGTLERKQVSDSLEEAYEEELNAGQDIQFVFNYSKIFVQVQESLKESCGLAIQDDYLYWDGNNRISNCGKLFTIDQTDYNTCLLYTSPSPRDRQKSRMPSSA
eukprot:TRINITY_DN20641_c0_g1_i1.p1 TRINITY_DN20641_c0_g1~~TRINITY_DN20641_c0_g1_i1.p1  ORF type:complete len:111 (+),score=33.24 TRINITY_DN20641_c0_g1_i1:60-392(+)